MQTDIIIDGEYAEARAKIFTAELTYEVRQAAETLRGAGTSNEIILEKNGAFYPVKTEDVECFYTANQKVEARTTDGDVYFCRKKIYELESGLNGRFVKINQGTVANLDCVKCFSVLFNGTMEAEMKSGKKEYVSRRTVARIKQTLGIGGK